LQAEESAGNYDVGVEAVMSNSADFYAIHMLVLLLQSQLQETKYLWKRCPQLIKADSSGLFFGLWEVAKALWAQDVPVALTRLSALSLSTVPGSLDLRVHLAALNHSLFASYLLSLQRSHVHIPLLSLLSVLQWSEAEALSAVEAVGWAVDQQGHLQPPTQSTWTGNEDKGLKDIEYSKCYFEALPSFSCLFVCLFQEDHVCTRSDQQCCVCVCVLVKTDGELLQQIARYTVSLDRPLLHVDFGTKQDVTTSSAL
jgi:hypothetical protein